MTLGLWAHNSKFMLHDSARRGFTLVELLVVISIIGILTGLVTVNLQTARKKARDHTRQADLANLASALEVFRSEQKRYPEATSGLVDIAGLKTALVPRYIVSLPRDPKFPTPYTYGAGYVYATNTQTLHPPGTLFVLDATLEQTNLSPLETDIEPTDNSRDNFFITGLFRDPTTGQIHYRVSSR